MNTIEYITYYDNHVSKSWRTSVPLCAQAAHSSLFATSHSDITLLFWAEHGPPEYLADWQFPYRAHTLYQKVQEHTQNSNTSLTLLSLLIDLHRFYRGNGHATWTWFQRFQICSVFVSCPGTMDNGWNSPSSSSCAGSSSKDECCIFDKRAVAVFLLGFAGGWFGKVVDELWLIWVVDLTSLIPTECFQLSADLMKGTLNILRCNEYIYLDDIIIWYVIIVCIYIYRYKEDKFVHDTHMYVIWTLLKTNILQKNVVPCQPSHAKFYDGDKC